MLHTQQLSVLNFPSTVKCKKRNFLIYIKYPLTMIGVNDGCLKCLQSLTVDFIYLFSL